jgi:hypothetical protein
VQAGVDVQTVYTSYSCDIGLSSFFFVCLCCVRINVVQLNVSEVICVGLARLEIPSKQVFVLLSCDFLLIDISVLKIYRSNLTVDRNLFAKRKHTSFFICHFVY